MKVGGVLDDTARLVQRAFERTFVPVTILLCATAALQAFVTSLGVSRLLLFVLVALIGLVGTASAQALQIEDVRRARSGEPTGLREIASGARRRLRTLVAAQLIIAFAVGLIAIVCLFVAALFVAGSSVRTVLIVLVVALVPAGILLLNWSLVPPLVVIEQRAPLESLRASSGMVEGRRLRLLVGFVVIFAACTLFVFLVDVTTSLVLHGVVEAFLISVASDVSWAVVVTAFATAVYYRLVGDRPSGAIAVSNDDLERWAATVERRRSAGETFRV